MRICQSKTTRVRKWKRKISKLDKDIRDKTSAALNRSKFTSLSPRKITEKPYSVKCLSKGPGEAFFQSLLKQKCQGEERPLLVCTGGHGGHIGGQEQKHFSPLVT